MQRWHVETSRNGRITASTSRFYGTDLPRLFGLFNDPESWPMESPERLIRIVPEELLSYSFDNDTRVEITFERIRTGLFRVNLVHEQLHDTEELEACQGYWEEILRDIFNRLLCEPVHAATAFGKINLFFKVGPLLENGYHQVASLYQSVNLAETVVAGMIVGEFIADFCDDPYACADGADALVILTEWDAFRALDLARVKQLAKAPVLVDLRNIYDPAEVRAKGFAYSSVGRA